MVRADMRVLECSSIALRGTGTAPGSTAMRLSAPLGNPSPDVQTRTETTSASAHALMRRCHEIA
jgi:hypothetical protein